MAAGYSRFQALVNGVASYFGAAVDSAGNLGPAHTLVDQNGIPITTAAGTTSTTAVAVQGVTGGIPQSVAVTSNTPANKSALNATATLTPSAVSYTVGQVVGGAGTAANAVSVNGGSATLNRVKVTTNIAGISPQLDTYIFSAPLTGTYTDAVAFNLNATDAGNLIAVASVTSNWPANGTGPSVGLSDPILVAMQNTNSTTNLYTVTVARTGFTLTTGPTMTVSLNATPL